MKAITNTELQHYGILGQKWGVRRYQNEDGSLTPAGKARYGVKEAKLAVKNAKTNREKFIAGQKLGLAKEKFRQAKILEKEERRGSKKYKEYVELYKKEGRSEVSAKKAAAKRVNAERVLKTIGTVAVGALAVKYGKSYINKNFDRVIKAGKSLQRVTKEGEPIRDAFYAAYKTGDKMKYRGLYGNQIKNGVPGFGIRGTGKNPVVRKMNLGKNVKIASEKSATRALNDLLKSNPEYKKWFQESADMWKDINPKRAAKMQSALDKGEVTTAMYRNFNKALISGGNNIGGPGQKMVDAYYQKLKDAGYDAIQDVNDKFFSGYNARDPLIVINKGVVSSTIDKLMSDSQIGLENKIATGQLYTEQLLPIIAASYGTNKGIQTIADLQSTKSKKR